MNNDTQPVTSPLPSPTPTVINLGAGGNNQINLPGRNWFNPKMFFLLGGVLVLLVGLGIGTFLVTRPKSQNIGSKAAGCDARWPADPGTACGTSTQQPAQGATNVSLSPNFHWDYGGYRPEDNNRCVQPSGCDNYSASVFLVEGNAGGRPFARASIPQGTTQAIPVKDAPFSQFVGCDYGNVFPNDPNTCHTDRQPTIGPLKPNTRYSWTVTPFFNGVVHAEQTWSYNFTTGAGTQTVGCNQTCNGSSLLCSSGLTCSSTSAKCVNPSCPTTQNASCVCPAPVSVDCVGLTTTADLNNLQAGTLYNFTLTTGGNGPVSSVSMPVYMNSCSNQVFGDAPLRGIPGQNTYTIGWRPTQLGTFVAYGKVASGTTTCQADCGGTLCAGAASCKLTGTVKTPPQSVGCNQTCNGSTLLCSSGLTCTGGKCVNSSCSPTTQDLNCACLSQSVICDSLTVTPTSGNSPLAVTATIAGHTTNGGSIASYKFDFGDGSTPVTQGTGTLAHTYATAGSFTVKGYVTDDKGNIGGGLGSCQTSVTVTLQGTVACQMVSADKDLASVKIGDVVTFTGYGITSDAVEQIDKVNFIISTPSGMLSDTTVAAVRDMTKDTSSGGKAWKGVLPFTVPGPGNYSVKIKVHWVSRNQWME